MPERQHASRPLVQAPDEDERDEGMEGGSQKPLLGWREVGDPDRDGSFRGCLHKTNLAARRNESDDRRHNGVFLKETSVTDVAAAGRCGAGPQAESDTSLQLNRQIARDAVLPLRNPCMACAEAGRS